MNFQALYFIQSCFLTKDVLPKCTVGRRQKTQALLSSETEPQDNQPVCNPSKESQLDGQPPQDIVSLPITFLVPPESLGSATKTKNPHVVSAVLGTRQSRAADTSKQRLNWRCYFGRVLSRVNLLHLPERGWECTAAGLTENSSWERHYCNETNSAEGKRRSGCVQIRFRQVTNWLH